MTEEIFIKGKETAYYCDTCNFQGVTDDTITIHGIRGEKQIHICWNCIGKYIEKLKAEGIIGEMCVIDG